MQTFNRKMVDLFGGGAEGGKQGIVIEREGLRWLVGMEREWFCFSKLCVLNVAIITRLIGSSPVFVRAYPEYVCTVNVQLRCVSSFGSKIGQLETPFLSSSTWLTLKVNQYHYQL